MGIAIIAPTRDPETWIAEFMKCDPSLDIQVYPNPAIENVIVQFPQRQKEVFLTLRYTDGRQAAYFKKQLRGKRIFHRYL